MSKLFEKLLRRNFRFGRMCRCTTTGGSAGATGHDIKIIDEMKGID